ncbi:MAG TPA: sugar-transfer associated ATP-grasp domain-containing protein [Saprospiraceae bacterium]|nr:sugar-transfer associated ATP-grasp domain-containing protein [Saprospiraceae bacterium]
MASFQLLIEIFRFYYFLTLFLLVKRKLPATAEQIRAWSFATIIHLWNKPCRIEGDTFSQYLVRSGVNLPKFLLRNEVLILIFIYLWPLLALLIVWKHKKQRIKQWLFAIKRPDLYMVFPQMRFDEISITQRRCDMFLAIFNAWDFYKNHCLEYEIENKYILEQRACNADIPTVPSLSLQEAKNLQNKSDRPSLFFVKNPKEDMGLGIYGIHSIESLERNFSDKNILIQPVIANHTEILPLLPKDAPLCTLRLQTTMLHGEPICHIAYFRVGASKSIVDNLSRGGTLVEVDIKTGLMLKGVEYQSLQGKMPVNDSQIIFQNKPLPQFHDAVNLAKKAHKKIAPSLISIGWDIALTDTGPLLIEANVFAGSYEILQMNQSYKISTDAILEKINYTRFHL